MLARAPVPARPALTLHPAPHSPCTPPALTLHPNPHSPCTPPPAPCCATLHQNAENEMAIIAAYYGLPTLSVRAATFHQMLRNQHGYKVRAAAAREGARACRQARLARLPAIRLAGAHRRQHSARVLRRWTACAPRRWTARRPTSCSCTTSATRTGPPATGARARAERCAVRRAAARVRCRRMDGSECRLHHGACVAVAAHGAAMRAPPRPARYMAELLIGLVQLTAGSLKARPLGGGEHELAAEPLPPPIIPGNYDKRAASCMMNVRRPRCRCGRVAGARGWSAPGLDAASCGSCGRRCALFPLCLPPPPCVPAARV